MWKGFEICIIVFVSKFQKLSTHEQFYTTAFVLEFMYFAINKFFNVAVLSKESLVLLIVSISLPCIASKKNQCKTSIGNINFYVLSYP